MNLTMFALCLFGGGLVGWITSPIRLTPKPRFDDIFPLMAAVGLLILLGQLVTAAVAGDLS